jgi:hypothetical protein
MSYAGKNYIPELPRSYSTLLAKYEKAMKANTEADAVKQCALVISHLEAMESARGDLAFNATFLKKLGNDMAHIVRLGHALAVSRIGRTHKDMLTNTMRQLCIDYGATIESNQKGLGST